MHLELVLSCEHAGAEVPPQYRHLFSSAAARRALRSHRGSDPGALALATGLAERLRLRLYHHTVTRLLVEVNRSLGHRQLFSEFTGSLSDAERRRLVTRFYRPHRRRVQTAVQRAIQRRAVVLHVGVHTFAARLDGRTRRADVGLLYDPARTRERQVARVWQQRLRRHDSGLSVRRNYPYRGASDGLTTAFRQMFPTHAYLGVELEVNQRLAALPGPVRRRCVRVLADSLTDVRDMIRW